MIFFVENIQSYAMTDLFTYDKEDFASNVLFFLKDNFAPNDIRNFIDAEIQSACPSFKTAVFRRIIAFRVGKEWWLPMAEMCNRTKITRELVAIWKVVVSMKRAIYDNQSVVEYAHERLADAETKLADGKINEQTFIKKCNLIMHVKEKDEALMDCCSCCPIGSMNPQGGNPVLHICCLPCGWDANSTCVRFT